VNLVPAPDDSNFVPGTIVAVVMGIGAVRPAFWDRTVFVHSGPKADISQQNLRPPWKKGTECFASTAPRGHLRSLAGRARFAPVRASIVRCDRGPGEDDSYADLH
jgi:hypothetical protein